MRLIEGVWKMLEDALLYAGLFSTDDVLLNNLLAAHVLHTQLASPWKCATFINDPPPTDNPTEKQTNFSVQLLTFDLMINLPYAIMLIFVMQTPEGSKVLNTLLCVRFCCCFLEGGWVVFCVHRQIGAYLFKILHAGCNRVLFVGCWAVCHWGEALIPF